MADKTASAFKTASMCGWKSGRLNWGPRMQAPLYRTCAGRVSLGQEGQHRQHVLSRSSICCSASGNTSNSELQFQDESARRKKAERRLYKEWRRKKFGYLSVDAPCRKLFPEGHKAWKAQNLKRAKWYEKYAAYMLSLGGQFFTRDGAGWCDMDEWEAAPLLEVKRLSEVDFQNLDTPYIKPLGQTFPAVDMIRLPNEMIQITVSKRHKALDSKFILQHLEAIGAKDRVIITVVIPYKKFWMSPGNIKVSDEAVLIYRGYKIAYKSLWVPLPDWDWNGSFPPPHKEARRPGAHNEQSQA